MNSPTSHPKALSRSKSSGGTLDPGTDLPSIDWWVTSRCNLSCDFCYGPKPAADPVDVRDGIAAWLSRSPARAVTFCGGEPLLVKKLPEYAERQRASGKLAVLNTNGELLRRRFGSWPGLPFDVIGVSIDGADSQQHRAMRGSNADLSQTLESLRWLREQAFDLKLKIGSVLSAVNIATVEALALLVRDLGPDVWRIYQYSPWGPQNRGQVRHRITDAEFIDAVARATLLAGPVSVKASTTSTTGGCLIVDPQGQVLRQEGSGYVPIGSCLGEPATDIWRRAPQQMMVQTNKQWLHGI